MGFHVQCTLLGIVGKAADLYRLNGEQRALETQFAEEYRRIRPNDTREIVDPTGKPIIDGISVFSTPTMTTFALGMNVKDKFGHNYTVESSNSNSSGREFILQNTNIYDD